MRISLVQALTAMPRVDAAAWQATPLVVRWLISARASVLLMTFTSAAFGGLLTLAAPGWNPAAWGVCTLGLLLAHATNNQLNDLTDSVRGIDEGNYFRLRYGAHVLEDGLLSRRGLIVYMSVTGLLAALCGVYLIATVSTGLIVPFVLGSLLLVFYTWPLKQWGLGELAVLLVWGPLMVGGTAFAASGTWDWRIALIGTAFALGPTTVIFGKHIDKIGFDRDKGVHTLPVRLGEVRARHWVQGHACRSVSADAAARGSGLAALARSAGSAGSSAPVGYLADVLPAQHRSSRRRTSRGPPGRSGSLPMHSITPAGSACCCWPDSVWRW